MLRFECRCEQHQKLNTDYSSAASLVVFVDLFLPSHGHSSPARLHLYFTFAEVSDLCLP